jgi:hypothetical protein
MWTGQPNQPMRQPMAAAMLVWRNFLSFSAAAAAARSSDASRSNYMTVRDSAVP